MQEGLTWPAIRDVRSSARRTGPWAVQRLQPDRALGPTQALAQTVRWMLTTSGSTPVARSSTAVARPATLRSGRPSRGTAAGACHRTLSVCRVAARASRCTRARRWATRCGGASAWSGRHAEPRPRPAPFPGGCAQRRLRRRARRPPQRPPAPGRAGPPGPDGAGHSLGTRQGCTATGHGHVAVQPGSGGASGRVVGATTAGGHDDRGATDDHRRRRWPGHRPRHR